MRSNMSRVGFSSDCANGVGTSFRREIVKISSLKY
jgi:hypothetical protein